MLTFNCVWTYAPKSWFSQLRCAINNSLLDCFFVSVQMNVCSGKCDVESLRMSFRGISSVAIQSPTDRTLATCGISGECMPS